MRKIKILMLAEWMDDHGKTATRYREGIEYLVEAEVARRAIEIGRATAAPVRQDAPPARCVWRRPPPGEPVEAGWGPSIFAEPAPEDGDPSMDPENGVPVTVAPSDPEGA